MYYIQKVVQLVLLVAVIWFGVVNFNNENVVKLRFFYGEPVEAQVVLVIFASMLIGGLISFFFSILKEWRTVRENRKKISQLKGTIKDLELKSKDLQIVQNELEKLKIDHNSALNEIKTLKEVLSAKNTPAGNQVEY